MQPHFKKLIIKFLEDHSDTLGNRGCNDFYLKDHGIPEEEWETLDFNIHKWNGDPQEHTPGQPHEYYDYQPDFVVCLYLAHLLKQELAVETQNQQQE